MESAKARSMPSGIYPATRVSSSIHDCGISNAGVTPVKVGLERQPCEERVLSVGPGIAPLGGFRVDLDDRLEGIQLPRLGPLSLLFGDAGRQATPAAPAAPPATPSFRAVQSFDR